MAAGPERVAETDGTQSVLNSTSDGADRSSTRRRFLSATAVGSATALAGCARLLGSGGDPLRVSVWSGNYADRFETGVVEQWEAEHDTEIEIQRSWDEIIADIQSAPADDPPFDVTVAEGNFYYYGRQADLWEPIREENVPNVEGIIDFYLETRDTEYGMPVDGAPCSIIYREDAAVEPTTWSDFSSAAAGGTDVGLDTGFWWYPLFGAAIAMDEEAGAGEMYDDSLHEDVLGEIEAWNVQSWASSGEDIWQAFDSGVIDVAQWYYDQTAYDIDDHEGLAHTMPEQNTGWLNNWCVVRGTDKRDEAEEFINFLMDADVQTEWAEHHPLILSNENVTYPDELSENMPTSSEGASTIAFPDWSDLSAHESALSDSFTSLQQNA